MNDKREELIKALQENPDARIRFFVAEEVCAVDEYFGIGVIDRVEIKNTLDDLMGIDETYGLNKYKFYVKNDDYSEMFDSIKDNDPLMEAHPELTDDKIKEFIDNLPWQKTIVIYVEP